MKGNHLPTLTSGESFFARDGWFYLLAALASPRYLRGAKGLVGVVKTTFAEVPITKRMTLTQE